MNLNIRLRNLNFSLRGKKIGIRQKKLFYFIFYSFWGNTMQRSRWHFQIFKIWPKVVKNGQKVAKFGQTVVWVFLAQFLFQTDDCRLKRKPGENSTSRNSNFGPKSSRDFIRAPSVISLTISHN